MKVDLFCFKPLSASNAFCIVWWIPCSLNWTDNLKTFSVLLHRWPQRWTYHSLQLFFFCMLKTDGAEMCLYRSSSVYMWKAIIVFHAACLKQCLYFMAPGDSHRCFQLSSLIWTCYGDASLCLYIKHWKAYVPDLRKKKCINGVLKGWDHIEDKNKLNFETNQ